MKMLSYLVSLLPAQPFLECDESEMVKKASKCLCFLGAIKACLCRVDRSALVLHQLLIRCVCNYAIPVFHASLPQYLIDDLKRVQRGLSPSFAPPYPTTAL